MDSTSAAARAWIRSTSVESVDVPDAKHHRRAACSEFKRGRLVNAAARSGDGDDLAADSAHRGDSCFKLAVVRLPPHIRTTDQIV